MHGKWFTAGVLATAGMLAWTLPARAADTHKLSMPSRTAGAPTVGLVDDLRTTDAVKVRGYGGYGGRHGGYGGYHGYSRGDYGGYHGYGRGYYGGYHGYDRGYFTAAMATIRTIVTTISPSDITRAMPIARTTNRITTRRRRFTITRRRPTASIRTYVQAPAPRLACGTEPQH